jgi:DUF4097 and DUF4098 domain-containing protein YvlB
VTSFETNGDVLVRVDLDAGEVRVETSDDPRVDVDLVALRDNDATRQAIEEARVELVPRGGGSEVVVDLKRRFGFTFGRGAKVGVRVRCPRGSDLVVRAGSADVRTEGSLGGVDLKSASGDISLELVRSLHADTASGDVHVLEVEESAEVRTASGDAAFRRCGGRLVAHLVSGDLDVGEAARGLEVKTVSGNVRVRAVSGGPMRVHSVSGDVELGVASGQRLYVDASSVSGAMRSELALDDTPPSGAEGAVHELRVRTVSGDLQIGRAIEV